MSINRYSRIRSVHYRVFALVCAIFVYTAGSAKADPQAMPGLDVQISFARCELCPCEPAELGISVRNLGGKEARPFLFILPLEAVFIRILDEGGSEIECKTSDSWRPAEPRNAWHAQLAPGESRVKKLVLHEWCSTCLSPGNYVLSCRLDGVLVSLQTSGIIEPDVLPRVEKCFPLRVADPDPQAVDRAFQAIAKDIFEDGLSAPDQDAYDHAVEMITYAQGSAPIPYQFRILRGELKKPGYVVGYGPILAIARNIISHANAQTAGELVCLLEYQEEHPQPYLRGRSQEILIWAVFTLHDSQAPSIEEVTNAFCATHDRPLAPQKGQFVD